VNCWRSRRRRPRLAFSLHTLAARGSPTGSTRGGWGVAFYQGETPPCSAAPIFAKWG
jgi:predicted glutamine amidotransferase